MIQITQDERGVATSLKIDGVELAAYVSEFSLNQKGGEIPELRLTIHEPNIEIELPQGIVIIEREDCPLNSAHDR